MLNTTQFILIAFGIYLLLMVSVALLSYRKAKNATDFLIGSRSLNFYVTALSAHASDMSNWLFMAYPATILLMGTSGAWAGLGLVVGMWANWHFVAPRLRKATEVTQSVTLSHYFAKRFNDQRGVLRTIGALASLVFFTVYVSAGLVGIGYLVESVLHIDRMAGMSVGLSVVVLYTLIGGYVSVCWVDLFQALFLLCMIILVPLVALVHIGGLGSLTTAATTKDISLSLMPEGGFGSLVHVLFLSLGWGLGYFGQTHILSKFMGIRDPKQLVKSKRLGMTWQVLCLLAATTVGLVGIAFVSTDFGNPELIFVTMVKGLFHPFFAGLILCGVIAATISTMDSQLLVLVPTLSEDIYHRFFRRNPSPQEALWSSRVGLILVSALAFLIACRSGETILGLVYYSWAGLGSTFGPVLILALYSKRVNWYGAVTGMLFGATVAVLWPKLGLPIPTLIPGFLLNLGVIYLTSLLTAPLLRRHPANGGANISDGSGATHGDAVIE